MRATFFEEAMTAEPVLGSAVEEDESAGAFGLLVANELDHAYRLAWAILGNDHEAQDATQDAFTLAWRRRTALRDPAKLEAWFWRILVNTCRDRLRKRTKDDPRRLLAVVPPTYADPSLALSRHDELNRALARLDADHRIVVVLRFWADLTVDDIAGRVGVPPGTVKSRLHHALRALRTELGDAR